MRVTRSSVGNEIAAKKDHVSHRIPPYGCEPGTITTADSDLHADAGRKQSDAQLQLFTSPDSFPVSIERRRQITDCHDDVECQPGARHNNSSSMIVSPKRVRR